MKSEFEYYYQGLNKGKDNVAGDGRICAYSMWTLIIDHSQWHICIDIHSAHKPSSELYQQTDHTHQNQTVYQTRYMFVSSEFAKYEAIPLSVFLDFPYCVFSLVPVYNEIAHTHCHMN